MECGCWTGVSKGHCPNKLRQACPEGWGGPTEAQTAGGILSSSTPPPRPPPRNRDQGAGPWFEGPGQDHTGDRFLKNK